MIKLAVPRWSALKVIGSSYPAKASVLMPFVGYLIIFQEDFVRFVSRWSPFSDPFAEQSSVTPFGLNFYFLYFGLFIFGVGSFIFSIFCDPCIKRHADSDAFCAYAASTSTANDIRQYCEYICARLGDSSPDARTSRLILQSITSGIQQEIPGESRIFAHKTYYLIKDTRLVILRCLVFASFIIGLLLMAVPSLIAFVKVCRMFFIQFY